jgi:hypothetical protein
MFTFDCVHREYGIVGLSQLDSEYGSRPAMRPMATPTGTEIETRLAFAG